MNEIVYVSMHKLTTNVTRHMHTTWELIYYTSGEGVMIFDDITIPYKEGDIIVVPPPTISTQITANTDSQIIF